jgi:hypothetical protein
MRNLSGPAITSDRIMENVKMNKRIRKRNRKEEEV